ncbi:HDOD domain-containing protein [Vibrio salinus]|uniref:HDOD domain-containing protein n=1 Tax=Vibrio salinus TaxID=2899784 RepID=UPI001E41A1EF|nr:HDOD domain-containing protein [Vibrio salinus]MCE0492752.1 HDOD domain-containing protein [Vibrio salinus]
MDHVSFFWTPNQQNDMLSAVERDFCQMVDESIANGKIVLPPIPAVVLEIQKLCTNEETTLADVSECLLNDPSLTAVVLRIANSIIFNRRNILFSDVHTAVSRLGISRVRDIVTAQSIEQLKYSITLGNECKSILRQSATTSRELGATMVLITKQFKEINSGKYDYLEPDKALLVGLLADIGLFCLLSEYQMFLDRGNYIDKEIILKLFESRCAQTSHHVLKCWGFDEDFQEVASNNPLTPKYKPVSYLDIAQMAYYLLKSRKQDLTEEEQDIELTTDSVQVLYDLSSKKHHEFDSMVSEVVNMAGF